MDSKKQSSSLDILGVKPIGDAANTAVEKSFQGVEKFLEDVCQPALQEVGLLIRDKVRFWRLNNVLKVMEKSQGKIHFEDDKLKIKAHPRVALAIIDNSSYTDDDELQEMWAGLFASTCNANTDQDENLIFVDLLKQLTSSEAKIIKYSCETARKIKCHNGLIIGDSLRMESTELLKVSGISEIHRLDRELDHMRSLQLIGSGLSGGFHAEDKNLIADITPTALSLYMYIKCQGHHSDPEEFWKGNLIHQSELKK
jgi:hypothetical protein